MALVYTNAFFVLGEPIEMRVARTEDREKSLSLLFPLYSLLFI